MFFSAQHKVLTLKELDTHWWENYPTRKEAII